MNGLRPSRIDDFNPASGSFRHIKSEVGTRWLQAWVYVPVLQDPTSIPLVAIHGISRGAKEQALLLKEAADRTGRIVIAPLFDKRNWKRYQQITRRNRGDIALLQLLDLIEARGITKTRRFDLFGYSSGAQFSHRFAMLYPQRIRRLTLAAAGWYTMPDADAAYPYGLGHGTAATQQWGKRMALALPAFLRLSITVLVGDKDIQKDSALRSFDTLDRSQGSNRFERGQRYCEMLKKVADTQGIRPDIVFSQVPGCQHSFSQCVSQGGMDHMILG
ncbi:hypothetical protein [Pseudaestuariivita rosea]|uniref:hypothetical protein n=1 Tax=Pseudaestuariivita rosea TaxID=2763263 RepID=UPI001ABA3295|nr:hypothetical protein [Pseudaestuariivita rosea]